MNTDRFSILVGKTYNLILLIIEKVLGIILITPAIRGVFILFGIIHFNENSHGEYEQNFIIAFEMLGKKWRGSADFAPGITSAIPIYYGLMSIAGAYLIKGSKKRIYPKN